MKNLSELLYDLFESEEMTYNEFSHNLELHNELINKTENLVSPNANLIDADLEVLRCLYLIHDEELRFPIDKKHWIHEHPIIYKIRDILLKEWEKGWISHSKIDFDTVPTNPKEFARWLKSYCNNHILFKHPLLDFLNNKSSYKEFTNYFYYGSLLDPPQTDLYARATVGLPDEAPRIEISKNYWDEMGVGIQSQCHNVWADRFLSELDIKESEDFKSHLFSIPLKSLERFVVSQYVTIYKKNWLYSIGHLGATEIYDPILNKEIIQVGKKYGMTDETLFYFTEHIKVDAIHGRDWLNKVVIPLVTEFPDARIGIARGAEMNLLSHYYSFDSLLELLKNEMIEV